MRIEIDTSTESKEHLHHLGKMLLELAGSKTTVVEENHPVASPDLFSMFNEPEKKEEGVFNLFNEAAEEKKPEEQKSDLVDNLKLVPY